MHPTTCHGLTIQEFYHFLQDQRAKSIKREYGFLHHTCNLPQTLSLWYLFTINSPNMDFGTTFFGQLKKPFHALGFWDFVFCVARSGKTPVLNHQ